MSLKKASRTKSLSLSEDFLGRPNKPKSILTTVGNVAIPSRRAEDTGKFLKYIDDNIIGKGVAFLGPFGRRKVVYADYTSSGRSLQFLEDYINKEVLPAYGDVNCTSAVTGLQSNLYNKEARDLVRSSINASDEDEIFFCEESNISPTERLCYILCHSNKENYINGNDTSATTNEHQLNNIENGNSYGQIDNNLSKIKDNEDIRTEQGPVLFVSTNEPSKNLLPWQNAGTQIVKISKNREGFLDLVDLEKKLSSYVESKRLLIGLFSGSSRLTGIFSDDVATTILLHQYGALSIWDYSASAPYGLTDMNPTLPGAAKDAIFFSSKKFIGGVQGPGILVVKKSMLRLHGLNSEIHDTAGAISAVRAGLVLQLKESIGVQNIMSRQEKLCKQLLSHVRTIPEIVLLGPMQRTAKRIPTICFLVKHPRGSFLHNRFVVAVLNDVFGIQATAGSQINESLGIMRKLSTDYDQLLNDESQNYEYLRPGYTRITIPFFMPDAEIAFILEGLKMVATEAWKLLPQYEIDERTGEWRHHSNSLVKERKWLGTIRYTDGRMLFTDRRISGPGLFPQNYADCLQTARNLFNRSRKMAQKSITPYLEFKLRNAQAERLRWYMLPGEAHELLLGHSQNVKNIAPFDPSKSREPPSFLNMFRHNSLSALDIKRFKSRSLPTSPVQIPVKRQSSSPTPSESLKTLSQSECVSPPVVRFSLGGEVTSMAAYSSPRISYLANSEETISSRNRCHSWSSAVGAKSINPQTRINLGLATHQPQPQQTPQILHTTRSKQRLCSCSSQTELFSPDFVENSSPTPSLQNSIQAGSDCTEEIQAYVTEVTKELATEIKSEIREVISKVKDVLENTDTMDMSSINMSSITNICTADDSRSDSVSASDVAEYLKGFSKEMASEVKSEIREAVNSMTDIMPSDNSNSTKITSTPEIVTEKNDYDKTQLRRLAHHRFSDTGKLEKTDIIEDSTKLRSDSFPRPNSTPGWHHTTAPSPESSTPSCPYTGAISKLIDPISTASQDSGINMCFHEQDESRSRTVSEGITEKVRLNSKRSQSDSAQDSRSISISQNGRTLSHHEESVLSHKNCDCKTEKTHHRQSSPLLEDNLRSPTTGTGTPTVVSSVMVASTPFLTKRQPSESDSDKDFNKWQHLPKDVWKQTAEAIDEFDMIRDGDRILVCLSGSSASLCVLHALRQFSRARGMHIELGVITLGACGVDPRALMLYMRDIRTKFYLEPLHTNESFRTKVCSIARMRNYNVLAMGNTLDKLADDFLQSMLQKGKLQTPQAHCTNEQGDLRIIRPFVYVRERSIEDFAVQKDLPTRPSSILTKALDASNSILRVQEVINPTVYENIKNALRPLLALRLESNKSAYEIFKLSLITRD